MYSGSDFIGPSLADIDPSQNYVYLQNPDNYLESVVIAHDPAGGAFPFGGMPIFGLLQPTPTATPISSVQLNQLALEICV